MICSSGPGGLSESIDCPAQPAGKSLPAEKTTSLKKRPLCRLFPSERASVTRPLTSLACRLPAIEPCITLAPSLLPGVGGGIGHMQKQSEFFTTNWQHRLSYGGELRRKRIGRGARPLSKRHQLHLVFKTNLKALLHGLRHPKTFMQVTGVVRQYAKRFFVKVESISVQRDHIHLAIRCGKRSFFQSFFKVKVVAGQIAQRVTGASRRRYKGPRVWKHRPFTRVVKGRRAEDILQQYIELNEREARGEIPYQKFRRRKTKLQIGQRRRRAEFPVSSIMT